MSPLVRLVGGLRAAGVAGLVTFRRTGQIERHDDNSFVWGTIRRHEHDTKIYHRQTALSLLDRTSSEGSRELLEISPETETLRARLESHRTAFPEDMLLALGTSLSLSYNMNVTAPFSVTSDYFSLSQTGNLSRVLVDDHQEAPDNLYQQSLGRKGYLLHLGDQELERQLLIYESKSLRLIPAAEKPDTLATLLQIRDFLQAQWEMSES